MRSRLATDAQAVVKSLVLPAAAADTALAGVAVAPDVTVTTKLAPVAQEEGETRALVAGEAEGSRAPDATVTVR